MFNFLSEKFSSIFDRLKGETSFNEQNIAQTLESIKDALLQADVPFEVVDQFIAQVRQEILGQKIVKNLKPAEQLSKIIYDKLLVFLSSESQKSLFSVKFPAIILVMGLQGSGKTTTLSKIAWYLKNQNNGAKNEKQPKILMASVDFYRPAAVEQLEILAQGCQVSFYKAYNSDPVEASQEIIDYGKKNNFDVILLDTSGRLHVDQKMLDELIAIDKRVNPNYKLLVLDSMTGQESLAIAQSFNKATNISGAILTKMDSDARGGLAFAFKYVIKKPILFVGVGEKKEDIEPFRAERIAGRILGMGDIKSLVEKAEQKIKQQEQESLLNSFKTGKFNLQDFAQQLDLLGRLGSLGSIMKYLPGVSSFSVSPEAIQNGEKEIKKFKAIISSMTLKERIDPLILNSSRKNRIAKGSGVEITDVNVLLSRFEQSKQMLKAFKQFGPKGFFK